MTTPHLPRPRLLVLWATLTCAVLHMSAQAQTIIVNGTQLTVKELAGVGRLPSNLRDAFGETFGSISGLVADPSQLAPPHRRQLHRHLPRRTRPRLQRGRHDRLHGAHQPAGHPLQARGQRYQRPAAEPDRADADALHAAVRDTERRARCRSAASTPCPAAWPPVVRVSCTGWPELPQAYNGKLTLDAEGIVILRDGSRLISDEYGPSIYRFSRAGRLIGALPVAASVRPIRNSVTDYSSNNPTAGQPAPAPANPTLRPQQQPGLRGPEPVARWQDAVRRTAKRRAPGRRVDQRGQPRPHAAVHLRPGRPGQHRA